MPLIISIVGFMLIFIINIISGNSFSVVFLRSLIYGGAVFGIVFGVIFVFKNYFGIDFDSSEQSDDIKDESEAEEFDVEKSTVDFMVGDTEEPQHEKSEKTQVEELEQNESVNITEDDKKKSGEDFGVKENEIEDDVSAVELNSADTFDDAYSPEETPETEVEEKPRMSSEDIAGNLKKKIGVDVSFSDIAKAIRTKINKD